MILGVGVEQVDGLIERINEFMPKGTRLVVEAEHEMCYATSHPTLADALTQQRIEREWADENVLREVAS